MKDTLQSEKNDVLEVLNIAKTKNGVLGRNRMLLAEGRITFGYVNDSNQIIEMKIPIDGIEIKYCNNIPY